MVTIRAYEASDRPALYDLLAKVWPDETAEALDRRWWWSTERPPILLAVDGDDTPVGLCAYLPFAMWSDGREMNGAWVVDFFVLPSHQGQGIGKRLVGEIDARSEFLASLSQTDLAWATFRRLGWRERTFAPLYLSPDARLATALALRRGRHERALKVEVVPAAFDASFQELWERCRDRVAPAALRDAGALRARFTGGGREYFVARAEHGGTLCGYMVLRVLPERSIRSFPGSRVVLVADHLVDPEHPGAFPALLREAARWTVGQRVRFLLCMATRPAEQRVLKRRGFLGPDTPLLRTRLRKLAVGFTATRNAPPQWPWHLTPMDCDMDLLFQPR